MNIPLSNETLALAAAWLLREGVHAWRKRRADASAVRIAEIEAGADSSIVAVLMTRIGELEKRIDALEAKGRVDAHELALKEIAIARKDSLLAEQDEMLTQRDQRIAVLEAENRTLRSMTCNLVPCDRRQLATA